MRVFNVVSSPAVATVAAGALGRLQFTNYQPPADGKIKVAFFDADSTLRVSLSGAVSANGPSDVALLPGVADKLAELATDGYLIAIVSNQNGVQAGHVSLKDADAALQTTIALIRQAGGTVHGYTFAETDGDRRKPATGMATDLQAAARNQFGANVSFDLQNSFMVGDSAYKRPTVDRASGAARPGDAQPNGQAGVDFSNSDRLFAENLGVPFHEPNSFFGWPTARFDNVDTLIKFALSSARENPTTALARLGLTKEFVDAKLASAAALATDGFAANAKLRVDLKPTGTSPIDAMMTLADKKTLAAFIHNNAPGFFRGPLGIGDAAGEYGNYSYYLLDNAAKHALVPSAEDTDVLFVSWEHYDEFSLQFYRVDLAKLRAGADDAVAEFASLPQASGLVKLTGDDAELDDEYLAVALALKTCEPVPFDGEDRKRFDEIDPATLKGFAHKLSDLVFAPYTRGNNAIVSRFMSDDGRAKVIDKIRSNAGAHGAKRFGDLTAGSQGTRFFELTGLAATRVAGLSENRYFNPANEHLIVELATGGIPLLTSTVIKAADVATKDSFAFEPNAAIDFEDVDNVAAQALGAEALDDKARRAVLVELLTGARELGVVDRPAFDARQFIG